ncbi:MAG: hypothetical protein ACQ9MH_02450 [Nitrospinales bacterium]
MTAKAEVYNCVETELINLVCNSPAILNKLRKILKSNQLDLLSQTKVESNISHEEVDKRVGEIEISYENDSTILVKADKRAAIPYDCRQLGFRDNRAKGWKFFTSILEDESHNFNFGTAYSYPDGSYKNRIKNKEYDAGWKLCNDLCKKLMMFFSREYGISFPTGFKLYEKIASAKSGERQFKFKITRPKSESFEWPSEINCQNENRIRSRYSKLEENELRKEVINLNSDFSMDSMVHNAAPDHMILAFKVGQENFGWSDETMKDLLQVGSLV